MKAPTKRIKERTLLDNILKIVHKYAYFETLIILFLYLAVGYLIDEKDICILNGEISYILILLAIITLFHGFENGILGVAVIALAMWYFYDTFHYIEFLVTLMMTLIFSEFHYYWNKKIKEAEVYSDYRGAKLDELSKAFYTLKISHDQLEKNYVIKPMSIRNSIEHIITKHREIDSSLDIDAISSLFYFNFLELLEKSFSVHSAAIIYKKDSAYNDNLDTKNALFRLSQNMQESSIEELLNDYLVDQAIGRKSAIYISDKTGEPSATIDSNSSFIAAIPALQEGKVVAVLLIAKMPFMAFNRENLTSISILLDYFCVEITKHNRLTLSDGIALVSDKDFRFETARLLHIHKKYKVNSIFLVIRIEEELQAIRIFEKIEKMLRSLDMVTLVHHEKLFHIVILFPLHDKAATLGFLNRMLFSIKEEQDREFNYMTFSLDQIELLNSYIREDDVK